MIQNANRSPNHEEYIRDEAIIVQETLSSSGASAVSTQIADLSADQEAIIHEKPSQILKDSTVKDVVLEVSDSEWQDASSGHMQSVAEKSSYVSTGLFSETEMSLLSVGTLQAKNPDETIEATGQGESVGEPMGEPEETRPASVW